jgi:predicted MPP superfamily phosphohydrolase
MSTAADDSAPVVTTSIMSPLRIAVFLLVASTVLGSIHYYLWVRLVRDTHLPDPYRTLATGALALLGVMIVVGMVASRFVPRAVGSPVLWVVYIWIGLFFFLFMLTGSVDLVRGLLSLAQRFGATPPPDPERRQFIARVLGAIVGVGGLGLAGYGIVNVLRPVAVKRVKVALSSLPAAASGFRIVQLTDVHVGPTIGKEFIEELVRRVNALEPDLVAITGDLVDGTVAELGALVAPLGNLKAKEGVFFVTGNHEYYSGVDEWLPFLESLGVRVLRNEHVAIRGAEGFDLAGIDDASAASYGRGHGADLHRAVSGREASRALVLLAHQPRGIDLAERLGVDLQLSGHTHGGQLFPWNFVVKLVFPFLSGLYRQGRTQVYVSEGTGYWGPPMRVGTAAEITHIELLAV